MVGIFILFAIYGILQKCLIDWPLVRRIKRSKNAKDAIACRKKLRFRRRLFLALYVLIVFVLPQLRQSMEAIESTGIVDPRYFGWVLILPLFLYWYLISSKNLDRLMGNISLSDKTAFLSGNKDYVLYLRGFETDDYSPETKQLKKSRKRNSRFSEYYFTRVLQTKETVCAVGMTKEVEAPIGAQRIYLDDETWQEDVLDLMRAAKVIYILVNDRPSCIWEIDQSLSMLDKTIFLVDEREKYDKVRQLGYEHGIVFPQIPHTAECQSNDFVAIRFKDGNAECRSYDKSLNGYAKMMGVPAPRIRKPGDMGCGCACVIVVAFFIGVWCKHSLEEESQKMQGMQEQGACDVPRPSDHEYGLHVSNVLNNVILPSPENSVEVVRGSEMFAELEKIDGGEVIGLKRFYCKSTSGLEGHPLNGLMDVVIIDPIHVTQKWQASSFKRAMEVERRESVPGKIISSQKENNCQIGEITYDKYEMNSTCVFVSDVSDKAFSFSVLVVRKYVKETQETTVCILATGRYVLIKGRVLMLRARDVFLDREEAIRHIGEENQRLEKWSDSIEASNIGIAESRCEYDARGNVTRMQWFDVDGKSTMNKDGVTEVRFEYDAYGNVIKEMCFGVDGKPTADKDGVFEKRHEYDHDDKERKRSLLYANADGKMSRDDGIAEMRFEYDARGNITRIQNLDIGGKLKADKYGVFEMRAEYDHDCKKRKGTYVFVDAEGEMSRDDGIAEERTEYDAYGNATRRQSFGVDGKPKADKDGVFELRSEYDQDGKERKMSLIYADADGKVAREDGIAEERFEYDARGNVTRMQHFGVDGKPMADQDGVSELRSEYDEHGNEKRRLLFNVKGELIQDGKTSEEGSRK